MFVLISLMTGFHINLTAEPPAGKLEAVEQRQALAYSQRLCLLRQQKDNLTAFATTPSNTSPQPTAEDKKIKDKEFDDFVIKAIAKLINDYINVEKVFRGREILEKVEAEPSSRQTLPDDHKVMTIVTTEYKGIRP